MQRERKKADKYSHYSVLNMQTHTEAASSQAQQPTGSTKAPGRPSSTAGCTLLKGWRAAQVGQKQTMQPYHRFSDEERRGPTEQLRRFSALRSTHTSLASFPMFDSTYVWTPDNTWGKLIGPSQGEWLQHTAPPPQHLMPSISSKPLWINYQFNWSANTLKSKQ